MLSERLFRLRATAFAVPATAALNQEETLKRNARNRFGDYRYVTLDCGHSIPMWLPRRDLERLGLMPCSECVDACGDHQEWLDERADDAERANAA